MPTGTGANVLQNIPVGDFVTDVNAFFANTEKNTGTPKSMDAPGAGQRDTVNVPQVGVVSKVMVIFEGTLTVSTAAVTTSNRWPYGLISSLVFGANGQNDLFNCDGLDLHVLRFTRYPSYDELVDVHPGSVGGGDSVAVASYDLFLTWELPLAMDDTTLVGSLFAQAGSTTLSIEVGQATMTEIFSANPANAAITGTFRFAPTWFEIPYDAKGALIIPDLTRMHGVHARNIPFVSTGDVRFPLVRSAGQLARLYVSAERAVNARLSALPSTASTAKIDAARIEYGGNQRPQVYDPAALLLATNNQHYGAPLPYDRLCFDFVRENPPRDAVHLQGITELNAVIDVNTGVTVTAGKGRVLQETLY